MVVLSLTNFFVSNAQGVAAMRAALFHQTAVTSLGRIARWSAGLLDATRLWGFLPRFALASIGRVYSLELLNQCLFRGLDEIDGVGDLVPLMFAASR